MKLEKKKVLSFKEWLFRECAIDYDTVEVTDATKEIWKEAYQQYLVLNERDENNE